MASRSLINPGELALSVALAALGIFVLAESRGISGAAGYSQVGPATFPMLIGGCLLLLGGALAWQAASGGWRKVPQDEAHDQPDWAAFGLLSAAVIVHMAAIASAGFILASTWLFALVARGFGSRRLLRDAIAGLAISALAFLLFTQGLGVTLPAGLLGGH